MSHDTTTADGNAVWPDGAGPLRKPPADEPGDHALIVDVDGFAGPLDLLLDLARRQKVDLAGVSILELAEQYLEFINAARRMQIELAADYLVMAAWLAYLKSRLLLPDPEPDDEMPAEEIAARLAFRLRRLDAMREAAAQLMARNRLGRDIFARGAPEPLVVETRTEFADNLFDLLKAYAQRRQQGATHRDLAIRKLQVWSIKEARDVLERLIGTSDNWSRLDSWLNEYMTTPEDRRTVMASSLAASLELVREGELELRQEAAFKPLYLRKSTTPAQPAA